MSAGPAFTAFLAGIRSACPFRATCPRMESQRQRLSGSV